MSDIATGEEPLTDKSYLNNEGTEWRPLLDDTVLKGDELEDRMNKTYADGNNPDAEKLNSSLKNAMKSLPLEHLSGAMTSYIGFMNMFVKKNLGKMGIHVGTSDEQFQKDLQDSIVTSKQLARVVHESLMDDETQIFVRELMIRSIDMMKDFTALLFTAFLEQSAGMVLDNGDKIAGIVSKGIESAGSAIVDGTMNAFSAVPVLGNFFSIIRTIHSLVMPMFTIGGGTLQMVMTGVSIMYQVVEKLKVPGVEYLHSKYKAFDSAKALGDHMMADVRDGMNNKDMPTSFKDEGEIPQPKSEEASKEETAKEETAKEETPTEETVKEEPAKEEETPKEGEETTEETPKEGEETTEETPTEETTEEPAKEGEETTEEPAKEGEETTEEPAKEGEETTEEPVKEEETPKEGEETTEETAKEEGEPKEGEETTEEAPKEEEGPSEEQQKFEEDKQKLEEERNIIMQDKETFEKDKETFEKDKEDFEKEKKEFEENKSKNEGDGNEPSIVFKVAKGETGKNFFDIFKGKDNKLGVTDESTMKEVKEGGELDKLGIKQGFKILKINDLQIFGNPYTSFRKEIIKNLTGDKGSKKFSNDLEITFQKPLSGGGRKKKKKKKKKNHKKSTKKKAPRSKRNNRTSKNKKKHKKKSKNIRKVLRELYG